MPHYYTDHTFVAPRAFQSVTPQESFAAVVGIVQTQTEREIVGRNGEHLQF
jgi:hypothetical protein